MSIAEQLIDQLVEGPEKRVAQVFQKADKSLEVKDVKPFTFKVKGAPSNIEKGRQAASKKFPSMVVKLKSKNTDPDGYFTVDIHDK